MTTFFCFIYYFFLLPKTVTTEGRIQDPDTNPVVVVVVVVFWTNPNPGRCFERSADVLLFKNAVEQFRVKVSEPIVLNQPFGGRGFRLPKRARTSQFD